MSKKGNPNFFKNLTSGRKERISSNWNWLYHNDHLRNVIKALIEAQGLTRAELTRRANISNRSALSNYLNKSGDRVQLSNLKICEICEVLGIEIELNIKLK